MLINKFLPGLARLKQQLQVRVVANEFINFKDSSILSILSTVTGIAIAAFPLLLYYFLRFINTSGVNPLSTDYCYYLCGFVLLLLLRILVPYYRGKHIQEIGFSIRKLLYDKLFNRVGLNKQSSLPEQNYIACFSYDIENISSIALIKSEFITTSITLLLSIVALFFLLGTAAIISVIILISLFPLSQYVSNSFVKILNMIREEREQRINLLEETLLQLKSIKQNLAEDIFIKRITTIRAQEIALRIKFMGFNALANVFYVATDTFICVFAFCFMILTKHHLAIESIVSGIAICKSLQQPLAMLARNLALWSQFLTSCDNFEQLFSTQVAQPNHDHCSFALNQKLSSVSNLLHENNNLFICLIGENEAVSAQLFELTVTNTIVPDGYIINRDEFFINASIADNISLDQKANQDKIYKSLELVKLNEEILDDPFSYEIKEFGNNLSGGQKQRLLLARADYFEPHTLFIDNPLTAVDKETASSIFKNLFRHKWQNQKKIIFTANPELLELSDCIFYINGQGDYIKYDCFSQLQAEFPNLELFDHKNQDVELKCSSSLKGQGKTNADVDSNKHVHAPTELAIKADDKHNFLYFKCLLWSASTLWWTPIVNGTLLLTLIAIVNFSPIIQDLWISTWYIRNIDLTNWLSRFMASLHRGIFFNLMIYLAIGLVLVVFSWIQDFFWRYRALIASKLLFERSLNHTLQSNHLTMAKISPTYLLQVFSADIDVLDRDISWGIEAFSFSALQFCAILIICSLASLYLGLCLSVALLIFCPFERQYRQVSIDCQNKLALKRSALFKLVLLKQRCHVLITTNKWLNLIKHEFARNAQALLSLMKLEFMAELKFRLISALLSSSITLLLIILVGLNIYLKQPLDLVLIGLSLVYTISITDIWTQVLYSFASTKASFTSVARVSQLVNLPPTNSTKDSYQSLTNKHSKIPAVSLEQVSFSYDQNLPWIFYNTNLEFSTKGVTGIIGRTGCGKSTLINLLLGQLLPQHGCVYLFGKPILSYSPAWLRQLLAVVPQEPLLISGTLRQNLCLNGLVSDVLLIKKLSAIGFNYTTKTLDFIINKHATNLTNAEKQLIGIARALLQNPTMLIFDEATSYLPPSQENQILEYIKKAHQDCCLIIITHKHNILRYCDELYYLKNGQFFAC